jgi:hydrogenase nickel incorporation protein HypB
MANIPIVKNILHANENIALENQQLFKAKGVVVINLLSSPGAGKTTLLEKTIAMLNAETAIGVIEGDIQSVLDSERIGRLGVPVIQINTDGGCHLDANMIKAALPNVNLESIKILFIENVGNLVCPAEFGLGEDMKVVVLSVAEGDEKPLKYPLAFRESKALVINKTDLVPFTNFDMEKARGYSLRINPELEIFEVSCYTGEGLDRWAQWLKGRAGCAA